MARPVNAVYAHRNQLLIERYNQGTSISTLASETGLSKSRIRKIFAANGIEVRHEPRLRRTDIRYRNNHLITIGARLDWEKRKRGWTLSEMAVAIGVSEAHLGDALQGLYDWRFTELARAAKVQGVGIADLLQLPMRINAAG